jgi:NADH-quinone oxidoreductase subunit C
MIKIPDKVIELAKSKCQNLKLYEHRDQVSLIISSSDLLGLGKELRDNPESSFDMLIDITAIDWYKPENRFEVVYFLYSNKYKTRLRLKVPLEGEKPVCPSLTPLWDSANWYERETYDMYGINFDGHPDLRRFYMPEDFNDPTTGEPIFPLRKDVPLMGIPGSMPLPPYPERDGELNK